MSPSDDAPVCPACASGSGQLLIDQRGVATTQCVLYADEASARSCRRGDLILYRCEICGLVFNAAFTADRVLYDSSYELDQSGSARYLDHLDAMAARALALLADRPELHVLEIGCGRGLFLHRLAARAGRRLAGAIGFDPAWRPERSAPLPSTITVHRRRFDACAAQSLPVAPDLIVIRHLIEHLAEPGELLRTVRQAAQRRGGKPAILIVETPDVDPSLEGGRFYDFYYEHCCLFSAQALSIALERAGWSVVALDRVFGGEYLLAAAAIGVTSAGAPPIQRSRAWSPSLADVALIQRWRAYLRSSQGYGEVAVWGAAGKGATFVAWVDPQRELVDCLIDVNPRKHGSFIAGTGHPVRSLPDVAQRLSAVLVMNDNYLAEVTAACREQGVRATIHPAALGPPARDADSR
ncbi:MAG TPA: class I SAM-dependent methyltransferase [Polyangiaceae bacterium]|nr:class I SAM-dependent methyltransferase [Polyangiaceae bacterium]